MRELEASVSKAQGDLVSRRSELRRVEEILSQLQAHLDVEEICECVLAVAVVVVVVAAAAVLAGRSNTPTQ